MKPQCRLHQRIAYLALALLTEPKERASVVTRDFLFTPMPIPAKQMECP